MVRALALLVVVTACGRPANDAPPHRAPTDRDSRATPADATTLAPTPMPSTHLAWKPHPVAATGLAIDVLADAPVSEGQAPTMHYVLQHAPDVTLAVWVGSEMSLAWWRPRFANRTPVFGDEAEVMVCGRPGRQQEVAVAAETATGVRPSGPGAHGHVAHRVPAQVHVAIAGTTTAGTPFVAAWTVAADRRDGLRADEARFLGSIRCAP